MKSTTGVVRTAGVGASVVRTTVCYALITPFRTDKVWKTLRVHRDVWREAAAADARVGKDGRITGVFLWSGRVAGVLKTDQRAFVCLRSTPRLSSCKRDVIWVDRVLSRCESAEHSGGSKNEETHGEYVIGRSSSNRGSNRERA